MMSSTAPKQIGDWLKVPDAYADSVLQAETLEKPHLVLSLENGYSLVGAIIKNGEPITLGRGDGNDLPLRWNSTVSTVHAILRRHVDLLTVEEPRPSTNGTFINGRRLTKQTSLSDRDVLRLGALEITVRCPPRVAAGGTTILPAAPDWNTLTHSERAVVITLIDMWPPEDRIKRPPSNAAIGEALGISEGTVRSHLRRVFAKLADHGVVGRRESLVEFASAHEADLRHPQSDA